MAKRRPEDESAGGRNRPRLRASALERLAKAWAVLAVLGLLAALAPACGAGGEPEVEGSPTAVPGTEDDALAPCRALAAFRTYRYSFNLNVESSQPPENRPESQTTPTSTFTPGTGDSSFNYAVDASVVAPDRLDALLGPEGAQFRMIAIGQQNWIQLEDQWTQRTQPIPVPYQPVHICEAVLPDLDLSQVEPQREKLNEVKTLHYTFAQVSSEQAMGKIFGPGSDASFLFKKLDVDLWLAEKDHWPIRIDIHSSGLYGDGREVRVHLLLDIRDANSDDIRVESPS